MTTLNSKIPEGPLSEKWTKYKASQKLVNPANKRKLDVIIVGTGLAGASAAASTFSSTFGAISSSLEPPKAFFNLSIIILPRFHLK